MTKLVVGNWKMNGSASLLADMAAVLSEELLTSCEVVICPPSILLPEASVLAEGRSWTTGAQDCSSQLQGARTGDTSAQMIFDFGATYVIVGHSERRVHHSEESNECAEKAAVAQAAGLIPIFCVGETLEQRESFTKVVLEEQLQPLLGAGALLDLVIAYEPVWSIGSGLVPELSEIEDNIAVIKDWVVSHIGIALSNRIRLLYGGSVDQTNADVIMNLPNVDGVLVGGASLDTKRFVGIVDSVPRAPRVASVGNVIRWGKIVGQHR